MRFYLGHWNQPWFGLAGFCASGLKLILVEYSVSKDGKKLGVTSCPEHW
jgi:hypothetical protein